MQRDLRGPDPRTLALLERIGGAARPVAGVHTIAPGPRDRPVSAAAPRTAGRMHAVVQGQSTLDGPGGVAPAVARGMQPRRLASAGVRRSSEADVTRVHTAPSRPQRPPLLPSGGSAGIIGTAAASAPDDAVMLLETPYSAGQSVLYRSKAERMVNPERLNLDRRGLRACPILEGEDRLRLLNYQNNSIELIANLHNLPNLIFLDLYNNQITRIGGLDAVPTLRVLMLGKNDIEKIEGLEGLPRLDVLDLHCNRLRRIQRLEQLRELRVLNLAGNQIEAVENVKGLQALAELNLRRNALTTADEAGELRGLQRVFLSNNQLGSAEALGRLLELPQLSELALDGNPLCSLPAYRPLVVHALPSLRYLDLKKVTDLDRQQGAAEALGATPPREAELSRRGGGAAGAARQHAAGCALGVSAVSASASISTPPRDPPTPSSSASAAVVGAIGCASASAAPVGAPAPPAHSSPASSSSFPPALRPGAAAAGAASKPTFVEERALAISGAKRAYAARRQHHAAPADPAATASHDGERKAGGGAAATSDGPEQGEDPGPTSWAEVQGRRLRVYGHHPVPDLAGAPLPQPLGGVESCTSASLAYMSPRHATRRWLPFLAGLPALSALSLEACDVSSLAQAYELARTLPGTILSLTITEVAGLSATSPEGALSPTPRAALDGLRAQPFVRGVLVSQLPELRELNGVEVDGREREEALTRFAALNRLAKPAPRAHSPSSRAASAATTRPSHSASSQATRKVAAEFVGGVLEHALAINGKLQELNRMWPDVVAQHTRPVLDELRADRDAMEGTVRRFSEMPTHSH